MKQTGAIFHGPATVSIELPDPLSDVLPGLKWGFIDAFPSPAYWAYQTVAHRTSGIRISYRQGQNLKEEVAACLLGGHGIPAGIGVAAFNHVRPLLDESRVPTQHDLLLRLQEPFIVNGRSLRYRFARQKARYLGAALRRLADESPPMETGRELRDWLLGLPGIGYKTASWIARNWLDADDIAILDIHILRAGTLAGFLHETLTVSRDYLQLERQFLDFSEAIGARPSELDAIIWSEMRSSPRVVRQLLQRSANRPGVK